MAGILITGARGFIGQHLSRQLASAGHRVCGLGHGIWPASEAASCGMSRWVNGDVTPGNLRLLQQVEGTPEVVFHLAGGSSVGVAIANPREDFFRTVATTAELLEWIRLDAPQTRLMAVSSAAVYGAGHHGSIAEESSLNPFSPYGHHKRLMEELCRSYSASYGIQVVIARLFSVFGIGLRKQLLWDLCGRFMAAEDPLTLGGTGDEMRDWTDVRDVVRALNRLAWNAPNDLQVVNVGTGKATSVRTIVRLISESWGSEGRPVPRVRFSGLSRPGDPFSLVAEPSRLQAHGFDWQVALADGLGDYVRWFLRKREATV
jgi:UDP-glucose 4-epimerase